MLELCFGRAAESEEHVGSMAGSKAVPPALGMMKLVVSLAERMAPTEREGAHSSRDGAPERCGHILNADVSNRLQVVSEAVSFQHTR